MIQFEDAIVEILEKMLEGDRLVASNTDKIGDLRRHFYHQEVVSIVKKHAANYKRELEKEDPELNLFGLREQHYKLRDKYHKLAKAAAQVLAEAMAGNVMDVSSRALSEALAPSKEEAEQLAKELSQSKIEAGLVEEEEGDDDRCPKSDDGEHRADWSTATTHDLEWVVDINCKLCGRSGSAPLSEEDVNW